MPFEIGVPFLVVGGDSISSLGSCEAFAPSLQKTASVQASAPDKGKGSSTRKAQVHALQAETYFGAAC